MYNKPLQIVNHWLQKILLLEQYCVLCGCACQHQICTECHASLPSLSNTRPKCSKCQIYLPPQEIKCQNCQDNNFQFERIIASFEYLFPIDRLLHQIKYHGKLEYSFILSKLFWDNLAPHLHKLPDMIIPVPLSQQKLKQRGFNQTTELIREFRRINPQIPIINAMRIKETRQQANLNRLQRINNLAGAFKLNLDLSGMHIALVDDVVTTGSTINELAKVCKSLGARQVDVWCLMRAQR